jgi:integrase
VIDRGAIKTTFTTFINNSSFPNVTPHVMRHTWATLAARRGVSMWRIAGVMSDSIKTVEKNYLHHAPEHLQSAVDREY